MNTSLHQHTQSQSRASVEQTLRKGPHVRSSGGLSGVGAQAARAQRTRAHDEHEVADTAAQDTAGTAAWRRRG